MSVKLANTKTIWQQKHGILKKNLVKNTFLVFFFNFLMSIKDEKIMGFLCQELFT